MFTLREILYVIKLHVIDIYKNWKFVYHGDTTTLITNVVVSL